MKILKKRTRTEKFLPDSYFNDKAVDWDRARNLGYTSQQDPAGRVHLLALRCPMYNDLFTDEVKQSDRGASDSLVKLMPNCRNQIESMMHRQRNGALCDLQLQALSEVNVDAVTISQSGENYPVVLKPDDSALRIFHQDKDGNFKIYVLEFCVQASLPSMDYRHGDGSVSMGMNFVMQDSEMVPLSNTFSGVSSKAVQVWAEDMGGGLIDWLDGAHTSGISYLGKFGKWSDFEKCVQGSSLFAVNITKVELFEGNARLSVMTEVNPRFCSFGSRLLKSTGSAIGITIKSIRDGVVVIGDAIASRPALLPTISEKILVPLTSNILKRPIIRVLDLEEDLDDEWSVSAPGEELPIEDGWEDLGENGINYQPE